jgi:riboflavin kinase/FMN adenylyltransferase
VLSEFQLGEESISSSRIRTLISAGDIDKANHLLGRPYRVTGEVIHGDSRGSKLGYRTANLDLQNDRLLPQGVYACSVHLSRKEKPILAVANFGFRPTFKPQNREMIMEVHLLDFSEEVYGEKIHLDLLAFLRPEKKFANPQELRLQIEKDCQKARALFGAKT